MFVNPLRTDHVYFVIACHAQIIVAHFLRSDDVECFLSLALKLMQYWTQTIAMCHHKIANPDFGNWSITICCKHFLIRRHTVVIGDGVSRPCARQNAPAWHKLEVGERLVETLLPPGLQFFTGLHGGNTPCHPRPQLFWIVLQRLARRVLQRIPIHEDLGANPLQLRHLLRICALLLLLFQHTLILLLKKSNNLYRARWHLSGSAYPVFLLAYPTQYTQKKRLLQDFWHNMLIF